MKKILVIIILLLVGLTVLAGYMFQELLGPVLSLLIDWGILILGAAGLIGIAYLVKKHINVIVKREGQEFFSIILLAAFIFTLVTGLVLSFQHPFFVDLVVNVQIPVETSLLAILAVVLLSASFRLIRSRGWTPLSISFLISAVITLALDFSSFYLDLDSSGAAFWNFVQRLPLVGARGVLLGIALGGLIVGLRILLTIDKPYGE